MSFQMDRDELERKQPAPKNLSIHSMSVPELLALRQAITEKLPNIALKDLDLEQELVMQYETLKRLQEEVLSDPDIPANQRAQVANAVGTNLQSLAKMQVQQYTGERFKQIEMLLINLLNTWPPEMVEKFFVEYEAVKI